MNKNMLKLLFVFQVGLSGVNLYGINERIKDSLKTNEGRDFLREKVLISLDDAFFEKAQSMVDTELGSKDFNSRYDELFSLMMGFGFNKSYQPSTKFGKDFLTEAQKLNVPNNQLPLMLQLLLNEAVGENNNKKEMLKAESKLNKDLFVQDACDLILNYAKTENVGAAKALEDLKEYAMSFIPSHSIESMDEDDWGDKYKQLNPAVLSEASFNTLAMPFQDISKMMIEKHLDINVLQKVYGKLFKNKEFRALNPYASDSDEDND